MARAAFLFLAAILAVGCGDGELRGKSTPSQDGKTYLVQYFERNRLEYHPENKGTPYEVLLGLLGVQTYQARYGARP